MTSDPLLDPSAADLLKALQTLHLALQRRKMDHFNRRVSFGDLLSERDRNAAQYGFGPGTTCYDNVLILGDVKVGANTWIGPNVILDGTGGLTIGDWVAVSAGVQIYSHDDVARRTSMGAAPMALSPTRIGDGVYIGPNTVIQRGVTIGDRAVIGAMSFVNRDIPPGARAWGAPARIQPTSGAHPQEDGRHGA